MQFEIVGAYGNPAYRLGQACNFVTPKRYLDLFTFTTRGSTLGIRFSIILTISGGNSRPELGSKMANHLDGGLLEKSYHDDVDQARPLTIKERLASLDGDFPMDEAVVEGESHAFSWPSRVLKIVRGLNPFSAI